jgi:hypothetical protein
MIFAFTLFQLNLISVSALEFNINTIKTNNKIIYTIDNGKSLDYSWSFNKNVYRDNINFSLKINTNGDDYSYLYNSVQAKQLSFDYHGKLPSEATIKIKVDDKFKDDEKLYLYYYNDEAKKLEYIDKGLTVKNGYVEFKINHCSDYLLTGSIVKNAINNPESMGMIIIILIGIGIVLVAATLFMNSKK